MKTKNNAIAVMGISLGACASGTPDLIVSELSSNHYTVNPGSTMHLSIGVSNTGTRAPEEIAADVGELDLAMSMRENGADAKETVLTTLTTSDIPLIDPRQISRRDVDLAAPQSLMPGTYDLCALVDPEDRIEERSEVNNQHCISIEIPSDKAAGADLIIESVEILAIEHPKIHLKITIKNIGVTEAHFGFRVLAFSRNPRWPLPAEECQVTVPAGCQQAVLKAKDDVPVGETTIVEGWFTFAETETKDNQYEWTGDAPTKPDTPITIDIMADGCFKKTDSLPLPPSCIIPELDELNNFYTITFDGNE